MQCKMLILLLFVSPGQGRVKCNHGDVCLISPLIVPSDAPHQAVPV